MKKILLVALLILSALCGFSQWIKPNNSYGVIYNRVNADSVFLFATGCGTPSPLQTADKKRKLAALAFDSCNKRLYVFDPKDSSWSQVTGGGTGSNVLDSLVRLFDTVAVHNARLDSMPVIVDFDSRTMYYNIVGPRHYQVGVNPGLIGGALTDGIISMQDPSLIDSMVSIVPDIIYRRSGLADTLTTGYTATINSLPIGYKQRILFFLNSSNAIDTLQGLQDTAIKITPAVPSGGILLTIVDVDGPIITVNGAALSANVWTQGGTNVVKPGPAIIGTSNPKTLNFMTAGLIRSAIDTAGQWRMILPNNAGYKNAFTIFNESAHDLPAFNIDVNANYGEISLNALNYGYLIPLRIKKGNGIDSITDGPYSSLVMDFYDQLRFNSYAAQGYSHIFTSGNTPRVAIGSSNRPTVIIGNDTTYDASSALTVNSTSQGFRTPRMTAIQMNAIVNPSNGLMVYNTTDSSFYWYKANAWTKFGTGSGGGSSPWTISGSDISNSNAGNVTLNNSVLIPSISASDYLVKIHSSGQLYSEAPPGIPPVDDVLNAGNTGLNKDLILRTEPMNIAVPELELHYDDATVGGGALKTSCCIPSVTTYYHAAGIKPATSNIDIVYPSSGKIPSAVYNFPLRFRLNGTVKEANDSSIVDFGAVGSGSGSSTTGKTIYYAATGQSNINVNDQTPGNWIYTVDPRIKTLTSSGIIVTADPSANNIAYDDVITTTRNNVLLPEAKQHLIDFPNDTVVLISVAVGSKGSWEWTPKTSGNGEVASTNTMLSLFMNRINLLPSGAKIDFLDYGQGEQDVASGNIPYWLNNVIEFRDSCAKHPKFNSNFTMVLNYPVYARGYGAYQSLCTAIDSIFLGKKDLAGRKIIPIGYDLPNNLGDTTHFTNEAIEQIGIKAYTAYKLGKPIYDIIPDTLLVKKGALYNYMNQPFVANGVTRSGSSYGFEAHQNGSTNIALFNRYDAGADGRQQGFGMEANNSASGGSYFLHKAEVSSALANRNGLLFTDTSMEYVNASLVSSTLKINNSSIVISSPLTAGAITSNNIITSSAGLISRGSSTTYRALNIGTSDNTAGSYGELYFSVASGTNGSPAAAIRGIRGSTGGALGIYLSAAFSTPALAMYFDNLGHTALGGSTSPTAWLTLPAGTATASTAPLKLTSGTNLTTPENGAVEYNGTDFFLTSSSTRYTVAKFTTGTAAPATTPVTVGLYFLDTTNKKLYVSTGTASSADWTILN